MLEKFEKLQFYPEEYGLLEQIEKESDCGKLCMTKIKEKLNKCRYEDRTTVV